MRFARLLLTVVVALLACPAWAQQPHAVPNPYDTLIYSDPLMEPDTTRSVPKKFKLNGYFRMRGIQTANLDLDRGPLPSSQRNLLGGEGDTGGDAGSADMRLLLRPALILGPEVSIKGRITLLDNLTLGSTPGSYPATPNLPMPAGSTSQSAPANGVNSLNDSIEVNALWLEWLSPLGLLIAGRATTDWGLGMVANSGNCRDCDDLQTADRIGLVVPLIGHLFLVSYDFDANGAHMGSSARPHGSLLDISDDDDLRTVSFGVTRYHTPPVASRMVRAGRTLFNWGAAFSYRTQNLDASKFYHTAPGDWPGRTADSDLVPRGLQAALVDAWFRVATEALLLEGEGAYMWSTLDNASLVPYVQTDPVTANQWGGVLRLKYKVETAALDLVFGVEGGVASGDEAFGFGVRAGENYDPVPGDLDGSQVKLTGPDRDLEVNNFRFNRNFIVDEILWRRIIGTVSDATYGKATVDLHLASWCTVDLAGIYSRAIYAQSTPGLSRDLGVEADARAVFKVKDGLEFLLAGAGFFPLDGFRNLNLNPVVQPAPAWLLRAGAWVVF